MKKRENPKLVKEDSEKGIPPWAQGQEVRPKSKNVASKIGNFVKLKTQT